MNTDFHRFLNAEPGGFLFIRVNLWPNDCSQDRRRVRVDPPTD
jgi:hypothetical protein